MLGDFQYDYARDYEAPKTWMRIFWRVACISCLFAAYKIFQNTYAIENMDSLTTLSGILLAATGILFLILIFRNGKSFISENKRFVKIENRILKVKLSGFSKELQIPIRDINSVTKNRNILNIHMRNGNQEKINLYKFVNQQKRKEFEQLMINRFPA